MSGEQLAAVDAAIIHFAQISRLAICVRLAADNPVIEAALGGIETLAELASEKIDTAFLGEDRL